MKRLAILAVVFGLAACSVTPSEFSRSGLYAGASVIGAASDFDNISVVDDLDKVDYTAGIGLRGGYRFLDRFAIEAAYEGGMDWRKHDVRMQTIALQGKVYPLTGAVQPYGLIGGGYASGKVSGTNLDDRAAFWRLGAGLEVYILPFLPLFFELDYTLPTGDLSDLPYATGHLGALFRF